MLHLILIEYKVPFTQVEPFIEPHIAFVRKYVDAGIFMLTGKKVPRTGGLIVAKTESREHLETILQEDPFVTEDLANFEITEFELSMVSAELGA